MTKFARRVQWNKKKLQKNANSSLAVFKYQTNYSSVWWMYYCPPLALVYLYDMQTI